MGTEAFLKPWKSCLFCLCVRVTLPRRGQPWLHVPALRPTLTLFVPTKHVTQGWSDKGWGAGLARGEQGRIPAPPLA